MPVKLVSREIQEYTPTCCKDDKEPLTVYFRAINKRKRDKYLSSLYEGTGNLDAPPPIQMDRANEKLLEATLCAKDGVFIKNAPGGDIKEMDKAISFIMDDLHPDIADEIETHIRSQSELTEEEEKN